MAKMMRRLMALAMVLSLLTGMIAIPAAAEEGVEPNDSGTVSVTVEITNDAGDVIGEKTTETKTETKDTSSSYTEKTESSSEWKTQDSQGEVKEPVVQDNVTTEESNKVVTDVEGTETSTNEIHSDKQTGVQTYSGSTSGSETTTITDITTVKTTTEDTVLAENTEGPTTTKDGEVEKEEWSDLIPTQEGKWTPTDTDDNGYKKVEGSEKTKDNGTTDIDVDEDPLDDKDVTLNMTAPTGKNPSTDSEKLYITIEEALANDIAYTDGQVLEDGSVVKYEKDSKGNVVGYSITTHTPTGGSNPTEVTPGTTGKEVAVGEEVKTYVKPEGYDTCEDAPIVNEAGEQIGKKTVKEIKDNNGVVIGYEITEEKWETVDNNSTMDPTNLDTPAPVRTLPARPEAPAPVTENGLTTTVTVEDIIENGEVVGYITTKRVTDGDGNEVSMESDSIYGTVTTQSSVLEKFPENDKITTTTVTTVYGTLNTQNYTKTTPGTITNVNTRDVTKEIYELVETKDGLFFLFEGKMYKVQSLSGQGKVSMNSIKPASSVTALTPSGDGAINETTDLRNPHYNDYVDANAQYDSNGKLIITNGYDYKYVGYGLESSITADTGSNYGNGTLVHQFKLMDKDGNTFYALCADHNTTADRGADYSMENVWDADYYSDTNAKKISAIAMNGYWGTASGVGSLDKVVEFLKANSNLDDDLLDDLTPGEALTATQAAIWHYGNSGTSQILDGKDATGYQYTGNKSYGSWTFKDASTDETKRINALYQALINQNVTNADVADHSTELLSKDNFATETKLVIKEKATEDDGTVKTDAKGNEKYLTDVTFTVAVEKSDLTGNLVIVVTDENGNKLREEQLKTDSSNLVGRILADGTAGSDYTIKDLELPEGVKINLNLSGTQNLEQGVYLYSAEVYSTSQTFVGIGSGTQQVNLNVQMEFSVTDPEAEVKHTTKTWKEKEVDTESYTKVDNFKREQKGTETSQTVTVKTETIGTAVKTNVTTKETKKDREWLSNYVYQLITVKDEDGGNGGGEFTTILDEEVPLADAPETGDISVLWAAMSMLSLAGMLMLAKRKED